MASYEEWNEALRRYFVDRVPQGSAVYLSVDEDALLAAGRGLTVTTSRDTLADWFGQLPLLGEHSMKAGPRGDLIQDFRHAVRSQICDADERVHLATIRGLDGSGNPRAVPVLAIMVLAASHMADQGEVSESNYFTRLREVLGIAQEHGRPRGMEFGYDSEEPLWKQWNLWLQDRGYVPTARRGEGPRTYISYPLSQALLRQADRERLRRLFQDRGWTAEWDAETVLGKVLTVSAGLSQHLQEILASGGQRLGAVAEAIFEEYDTWRVDPHQPVSGGSRGYRGSGTITAGVYRVADVVTREVEYYLYPRQRHGQEVDGKQVEIRGEKHTLTNERPGWLAPIGPIGEQEIEQGLRLQIEPPGDTHTLVLPPRSFWVLIPDPENPESGVYGTWGTAPLGTTFVVLCRRELLPDLQRLRDERLIEWTGEPAQPFEGDSWVEIRQCMVVSEAWRGVFAENRDLYEALRPMQKLSVAPSGGLRVPGVTGWLEGYGPQITVYGFYPEASIRILRASDEQQLLEETHATGSPIAVAWAGPGVYRIEASCGGEEQTRVIRIVSWDDLTIAHVDEPDVVRIGEIQICGALVTGPGTV